MSKTIRIAREEWRLLWRDRVAMIGVALLLILTAIAAFTAWEQRSAANQDRMRYQSQADREFEMQPDRHPHRMVHYGTFAFRPIQPLAAFDAGIDPYTGHTLYLEGHRQNSANFADVRQSSLLLRFGQLNPAFVLQVLAPLLLIFMGHAAVAREREAGTLRMLLAQGLRPGQLVAGKLLALIGVCALMLVPAALALAWIATTKTSPISLVLVMLFAYGIWLVLWAVAVVGVSAFAARSRDALIALLALWALTVVLVPRLASEVVAYAMPLPTRIETDIAVGRDLAAMGDSHNPDDPYFSEFRNKVLAQFGVSRVEDLPVNYKGVLAMEGERLTSDLFNRYAERSFALQEAQLQRVDAFSLTSPVLALRRISMIAAGTDLHAYRRFLEQAESHRYELVQRLNRMQAEKLNFATDKGSLSGRISNENWHNIAEFRFEPETASAALRRATPMAGVLLAWLAALVALILMSTRRLAAGLR
jgi:ABC-2 type transport system permease protein